MYKEIDSICQCVSSDSVQRTLKRGINNSHASRLRVQRTTVFLPRFDVIRALCDYTRTDKWNLLLLSERSTRLLSVYEVCGKA